MSEGSEVFEGRVPTMVRLQLAELVAANGTEILADPRRVRAMLSDTASTAVREINLVNLALSEGVPDRLAHAADDPVRLHTEIENLIRQLERNNALHRDAAEWAVRSCAWALGLDTPPENLEPVIPTPTPTVTHAAATPTTEARAPDVDAPASAPEPGVSPTPPVTPPVATSPPVFTPPPAPPVAPVPVGPAHPAEPKRNPRLLAVAIGAVAIVVVVALIGAVVTFSGGGGGSRTGTVPDPTRLVTTVAPAHATCPGPTTKRATDPMNMVWTQPAAPPLRGGVVVNPAQSYGSIVVATDRGDVAGFEPDDGSEVFRERLDGPVVGDPGQEGALYYGTTAGGLYKVDPSATSRRASLVLKVRRPLGGVSVRDGIAYVGRMSADGGLLVVDLRTQTVQRVVRTDGAVFGKPFVDTATNSVYFASTGGRVYRLALPGTSAAPVDHFAVPGRIEAGVRIANGRLVVANTDGLVETLNPMTGALIWRRRLPQGATAAAPGVFFTPTVSGGQTVVASADCRVSALDDTGALSWNAQFDHAVLTAPIILGVRVVSADVAGCVDVLTLAPSPGQQIVRSSQPCLKVVPLSMTGTKNRIRIGTRSGQVVDMTFTP